MSYAVNAGEIDIRQFTGPARISARSADHVARGLEASLPEDATPDERTTVTRVVGAADDVVACLLEREQGSAARVRPAFVALGTAFSVFGELLAQVARLPADVSPRGPRAAALLAEVFPEGTAFAQLEAGQAWSAARRRLLYIDDKNLGPAIAELIGADVLEAARRATATLREASGAGPGQPDVASPTGVAEKLAVFSRLVGFYGRLLASKVDETDPATLERFRRAVMPLEQYRANRRGQPDDDDEPVMAADPAIAPGMPGSPPFLPEPTH